MSRLSRWIRQTSEDWNRRRGIDPHVRPVDGYPSSIVDTQACPFSLEMYYHVGYAYHLHRHGLLRRTISCIDTRCFYWFSPDHHERYTRRVASDHFRSIDQVPHQPPAWNRWKVPDFQSQYESCLRFDFDRPILPIFNKYNNERNGIAENFLSRDVLRHLIDRLSSRFQIVYFRPVDEVTRDEATILDLREKDELVDNGVVLAEDLLFHFQKRRGMDAGLPQTYNLLQLCVIAQSPLRIAVQGGATYLNAMFPGRVFVLHRFGNEVELGTYRLLQKAAGVSIRVFDHEFELASAICEELQNTETKVSSRPAA